MEERGPSVNFVLGSLTAIGGPARRGNVRTNLAGSARRIAPSTEPTYWSRPPSFSDNRRKTGCPRKPIPPATTSGAA